MFCSQCGKQIEDNAKFCKYCGNLLNSQNKSIVNTPTHYKGQADPVMMVHLTPKIIYALLMIACTIFSALGGLIPSISVSLWSYSKECSVRDIWKLLSSLEDWGLDIEGFRMVLLVITGGYLVSAIAGVVMLLALLQRKKKYSLANPALVSAWTCIAADAVMILTRIAMNAKIAEELYEMEIFSTPAMGWLLLIIPMINAFFFVRGYLGEDILGTVSQSFQKENERIVEEKVCMVCKTRYTLGSKCPKCGSTAVEK